MKNIFLYFILIGVSSCVMIDDEATSPDSIVEVLMTKDHLIGETWYLNGISVNPEIDFNDDGVKSNTIHSDRLINGVLDTQLRDCELDNSYKFNSERKEKVTVRYGENLCRNREEDDNSNYEIDPVLKTLKLPVLIGNLGDNNNMTLSDVIFTTQFEDESVKSFLGNYSFRKNGTKYECFFIFKNDNQ